MNLEWAERVRGTKLYDLLAAAPLAVWFGRGMLNDSQSVPDHLRRIANHTEDLLGFLQLISVAGSVIFCALLLVMLVVRTTPRARAYGVMPRLLAFAGTFLGTGLLYCKPVPLTLPLQALADILIVGSTVLAIVVLVWLGRAFAIMAEARTLVTTGPYAIVRHPLYVVEELGMIAMLIQFASPLAFAIVLAQLAVQSARTVYEERILAETFPEYAAYQARTARFIPGVI
jgi:protein-S-isoprenylcysteine O-methyltransferase Ste14